jgi:hypothetical protein
MFKIMFALHLVFVIFTIGPLVHATTTATRGLRRADPAAAATSARTTRIYAYASILAIVFGFALMSSTSPFTHTAVAQFSEAWIWLSLVLWVVAAGLALAVTAPALSTAAKQITNGKRSAGAPTARVAASGGAVGVILLAVVFLMVYQPGG